MLDFLLNDFVLCLSVLLLVLCIAFLLVLRFKGHPPVGALRAGSGHVPRRVDADKNIVIDSSKFSIGTIHGRSGRDMSEAIRRMGAINAEAVAAASRTALIDRAVIQDAITRAHVEMMPSATAIREAREGLTTGVTQPNQSLAENMQGMVMDVRVAPTLRPGYRVVTDKRGRVTHRLSGRIVSMDEAYGVDIEA